MTKVSLTNDLKRAALKQYHPYLVIGLWSLEQELFEEEHDLDGISENNREIVIQDRVNLKIIEQDIVNMLSSEEQKQQYQKFVSKPTDSGIRKGNYDNIIFTPYDDIDTIIPYEYYNGVFYLELPRFYHNICLHLVTKYYDATDNVALITTEDIIDYMNNPSTAEEKWLNSANRTPDKVDILNGLGRYLIDIHELSEQKALKEESSIKAEDLLKTEGLSIEIDVFYKYTGNIQENQIGIIDTNDRGYTSSQTASKYEDQKTLIENNKNLSNSTNQIITATRNQENIKIDAAFTYSNPSSSNDTIKLSANHQADATYELIVKYINDNIKTVRSCILIVVLSLIVLALFKTVVKVFGCSGSSWGISTKLISIVFVSVTVTEFVCGS